MGSKDGERGWCDLRRYTSRTLYWELNQADTVKLQHFGSTDAQQLHGQTKFSNPRNNVIRRTCANCSIKVIRLQYIELFWKRMLIFPRQPTLLARRAKAGSKRSVSQHLCKASMLFHMSSCIKL